MSDRRAVLSRYPPESVFGLRIGDVPLAIHTNDSRLAASLRHYFAAYLQDHPAEGSLAVYLLRGEPIYQAARLQDTPHHSADRGVKEAYYDAEDARVVVKRRTGVTTYVSDFEHMVVGDLATHFNQAVNAVCEVYGEAMLRRGYGALHASAVLGPQRGVAFASASGSGKSTAALSMLESGWRLVTNDWLFVRPIQDGVEMVGVPKRPRVNPGTLMQLPRLSAILSGDRRALYGRMSPEALYSVKDKHEVDVDALYGAGTFRLRAIVHAVYVLRWSAASSGWEVRPLGSVEREAVLLSFAKGAGIYDRRGDDPVAVRSQIQEVARAVAVYEVYGRIDVARLTAAVLEAASAHEGFTTQRPR